MNQRFLRSRTFHYLIVLAQWAVLLALLAIRLIVPLAKAVDYVAADENDDIRRAWKVMDDDTQPIPIIR